MNKTHSIIILLIVKVRITCLRIYIYLFNKPQITYKSKNPTIHKSKLKAIYEANRNAHANGNKWHVAEIPPGQYMAIPEKLYKCSGLESVYETE